MTAAAPQPRSLYESAAKIYPRSVSGRYARLRSTAAIALLGIFYLLPWLQWNDRPLVLFDLPARRFHLFGLTLVPQDLYLLTGVLLIAALTLFLFTTVAGRLWCGYACPQTVWTEVFLWIERLTEGDRYQRIRLDRAPWRTDKILRKTLKHGLWLLLAAWTGISFVGYFVPARELWDALYSLQLDGWPAFWSLFYGFATWGNAGFMREQVCRYMCPYARFQSVMFDRDTLVIAYDPRRGEPRKSLARRADTTAGDCIDCTLCVQVCPTGIDIRDGLQYECIACAACIDACDAVMARIDRPRGLIRYSSARRDRHGQFRILRPRALAYAGIWLLLVAAFSTLLALRAPLELDVLRDRHGMGRRLADGRIENIYTLKITNKRERVQHYQIGAVDEAGQPLEVAPDQAAVNAGATHAVVVAARLSAGSATAPTRGIEFQVVADDGPRASAAARFVVGVP